MKKLIIKAKAEVKLKAHDGQFTKSYFVSRARYDFEIRNWWVEEKNGTFSITNTHDKKEERVYHDGKITNCSCISFVENEVGTCMHIEAIKSLDIKNNKIRPIVYFNNDCELKQRAAGKNSFRSPTVQTYLNITKEREIASPNISIADFNIFPEIKFYKFQESSILNMINGKRTILALKMGLGKTLCALASTKVLTNQVFTASKPKTIIISPNNLKYQWQGEINRFDLGTSLVIEKGSDLTKYNNHDFIILSYQMLNHHHDFITNNTFNIAIIDEIQKVKNGESITWKTISLVKSEYLFALSGTPVQNAVSDLLSIINIVNPYELKPEWKIYNEFCITSRARILGLKREKLPKFLKRIGKYIINPVIDHAQFSLPTKHEHTIKTKLTTEQHEVHKSYIDQAKPLIARSFNYPLTFGERAKLNAMLLKARLTSVDSRLIGGNEKSKRFVKIEEKILELTDDNKSVIVFSEWINSLNLLKEYLEENQISYCEFNGKISAKQKNKNLNNFITGQVKVFLSTDSGGEGIDGLQLACHNVIHTEPLWNPKRIAQRNGRVVRTLQKANGVNVYYFRSDCEIEEYIENANLRKNDLFNELMSQ